MHKKRNGGADETPSSEMCGERFFEDEEGFDEEFELADYDDDFDDDEELSDIDTAVLREVIETATRQRRKRRQKKVPDPLSLVGKCLVHIGETNNELIGSRLSILPKAPKSWCAG